MFRRRICGPPEVPFFEDNGMLHHAALHISLHLADPKAILGHPCLVRRIECGVIEPREEHVGDTARRPPDSARLGSRAQTVHVHTRRAIAFLPHRVRHFEEAGARRPEI